MHDARNKCHSSRLTCTIFSFLLPAMNAAEKIVAKFGGARALARAVGKPSTTVQSWKKAGLIPAKHQPDVLSAAKRSGIELRTDDFFPDPGD